MTSSTFPYFFRPFFLLTLYLKAVKLTSSAIIGKQRNPGSTLFFFWELYIESNLAACFVATDSSVSGFYLVEWLY